MTARGLSYMAQTLFPAASSTTTSAATVVLFAHANGFCKECFLPVWEELAAAAAARPLLLPGPVRLVAFDFHGHGDSGPVSGDDCDWRRVAAGDVKAMLAEVGSGSSGEGGGPCLGVGHSLGAAAMVMAELEAATSGGCPHPQQQQQPLFNAGLVLIEPILLSPDEDRSMIHPLADRALKRKTSWPSRAAARDYLRLRPVFARWDARALDAYVDHALAGDGGRDDGAAAAAATAVTLKCSPQTEAAFYRGAGPSVWPDLYRLGHTPTHPPVLFLAGSESDHMRVILRERGSAEAVARELADMMGANTRLAMVPGASHFLPMERPGVVAGLILEQLAATFQSGRPRALL